MRKGKRTWIKRHEANSSSWMEIWNAKSGCNMYYDFEAKFEALPKVHFRQTIYCFKALKVKNPTFQTMCKSKLKKKLWPFDNNYAELKDHFEIQLMNSKFNLKWSKFWIHTLPRWYFAFSTSGIAYWELHPPLVDPIWLEITILLSF